jgi:hypothetical protein
MKAYQYILFLNIIFLNLYSHINTAYPDNYTIPYLFSIRIGSQSKEIKLLLNSLSSNNFLFSNSNRKYSKEISEGRLSDAFIDKIEFNGQVISDFPFSLILDHTGFNSPEIQGEFGLGIDKDNRNDLIENLFSNQIITKRKIILETSDDLKENKININAESIINEFKFCNLTRKSDLDNFYNEAWVCELSHIIEEEKNIDAKNLNSSWDNAISIRARALFDTRQKYIILPIKFYEFFENFWNLDECEEILDESLDLEYFSCDNKTYETIKNDKPIYFIIDGYGFKFNFNELFQNDGNIKNSIIRFTNIISNSNIFIFGIPFFKKYDIMFDYENKRVGFKGDNIIDFTKLYNNWKEEETVIKINESNAISILWRDEKVMMIIGAVMGGIIILYVIFFVIRSMKRDDANKVHSNFIEQVRDY